MAETIVLKRLRNQTFLGISRSFIIAGDGIYI